MSHLIKGCLLLYWIPISRSNTCESLLFLYEYNLQTYNLLSSNFFYDGLFSDFHGIGSTAENVDLDFLKALAAVMQVCSMKQALFFLSLLGLNLHFREYSTINSVVESRIIELE